MGLDSELWGSVKDATMKKACVSEEDYAKLSDGMEENARPRIHSYDMASKLYRFAFACEAVCYKRSKEGLEAPSKDDEEELAQRGGKLDKAEKADLSALLADEAWRETGLNMYYHFFENDLRRVFEGGCTQLIQCYEKGAPKQKRYTQQTRDKTAKAKKYPDTVVIRDGCVVDTAVSDDRGKPASVPRIHFVSLVRSRRLLPYLVEYLVTMMSNSSAIPNHAKVMVDYKNSKGEMTVLEISGGQIYSHPELVNTFGEGERAAVHWMTQLYPEPVEIDSLDGDMAVMLLHYMTHVHPDHTVYWRKRKAGRGEEGDYVFEMKEFTRMMRLTGWEPENFGLCSILCGNDFVLKKWYLKGVGGHSIRDRCLNQRQKLIPLIMKGDKSALEALVKQIIAHKFQTEKTVRAHTADAIRGLRDGKEAEGEEEEGSPAVAPLIMWNLQYWMEPSGVCKKIEEKSDEKSDSDEKKQEKTVVVDGSDSGDSSTDVDMDIPDPHKKTVKSTTTTNTSSRAMQASSSKTT